MSRFFRFIVFMGLAALGVKYLVERFAERQTQLQGTSSQFVDRAGSAARVVADRVQNAARRVARTAQEGAEDVSRTAQEQARGVRSAADDALDQTARAMEDTSGDPTGASWR